MSQVSQDRARQRAYSFVFCVLCLFSRFAYSFLVVSSNRLGNWLEMVRYMLRCGDRLSICLYIFEIYVAVKRSLTSSNIKLRRGRCPSISAGDEEVCVFQKDVQSTGLFFIKVDEANIYSLPK